MKSYRRYKNLLLWLSFKVIKTVFKLWRPAITVGESTTEIDFLQVLCELLMTCSLCLFKQTLLRPINSSTGLHGDLLI